MRKDPWEKRSRRNWKSCLSRAPLHSRKVLGVQDPTKPEVLLDRAMVPAIQMFTLFVHLWVKEMQERNLPTKKQKMVSN